MLWKIIKNMIKFFTKNMKINALNDNEKVENKIENSNINAPVQQAHTIVNNIASNKIPSQDARISATKMSSGVYANFICKNCGTSIGLLVGGSDCPTCGLKIEK
ncbi:MAG: hypothetical protein A2998_00800 [Candidatus Staskawiczbacteria bacterium RIFCSPLOWO2_01_FULL_37_25b]|uniref:Uncharacterized protein n=2 Tax=Candidatus Staskawicziibacteriota TaxID=1817916 RepID=A0A1G2HKC9_9BACT|nr:MAG: hypothetical protein A2812_01550 [Candidatus Staskawiczbacteria bacterium RIFCSPHIGHO2_01_FULL_36_16]OGZ71875.1 MAG: hypothetical protein A2998_00800 [Candidatus Staskawiczbacteria bacterium RIFCSPLOWO2_01_FULL_37_25b]